MTTRKHPPLLRRSDLTDRVYVLTRYTRRGENTIVASEKWDVTDEFNALAADAIDALTARVAQLEACLTDTLQQLELGGVTE